MSLLFVKIVLSSKVTGVVYLQIVNKTNKYICIYNRNPDKTNGQNVNNYSCLGKE